MSMTKGKRRDLKSADYKAAKAGQCPFPSRSTLSLAKQLVTPRHAPTSETKAPDPIFRPKEEPSREQVDGDETEVTYSN